MGGAREAPPILVCVGGERTNKSTGPSGWSARPLRINLATSLCGAVRPLTRNEHLQHGHVNKLGLDHFSPGMCWGKEATGVDGLSETGNDQLCFTFG